MKLSPIHIHQDDLHTHKYLQDYYDKHGPEEFIKFCNTENEKQRNLLEEFIIEHNDDESIIYTIIANGDIDMDHVHNNIKCIDLLKQTGYDLGNFEWVRYRESHKSLKPYLE